MTESVHPAIAAAQRYRAQLLAQERQSASRLVEAYGRAYNRMGDSIRQLEARLSAGVDSEYYRNRADALRSLRAQVVDEVNKFAVYADQEITANARRAIGQGIGDSGRIVGAYFGNNPQGRQMMAASWDVLPTEAVETMLGFLAPDSPLHTRLVGILGETVAASMERHLTDAIAVGFNPRKTASIVRQGLGVGLTWALNTARTAQLYAYREATRANYMANSDVVSGWTWFATLAGNRTCMSCIAQHGSKHPVTETLNDHHAGRCVAIPIVPLASRLGISMPEIETGEEWFKRQPESRQLELMGPGMFDAWQLNQFRFRDLSRPYHDPVYGTMLRQSSLRDLLNRGAPPPFGGSNRPPSGQEVPSAADLERARMAGEQMRREQEMQRRVEAEKQRLQDERITAEREATRLQMEREARETGEQARLAAQAAVVPVRQPAVSATTVAQLLNPADDEARRMIEMASDTVARVHKVPGGLISIPVYVRAVEGNPRADGAYAPMMDHVTPGEIVIRPAVRKEFSFLHELGHYLDHQLLAISEGLGGVARSNNVRQIEGAPEALRQKFWDTINRTTAVSEATARRDYLRSQRDSEWDGGVVTPEERYLKYQLMDLEVWARAYAQYVSVRSGRLGGDRKSTYAQWDDAEFEPVAAVIDEIFEAMGLKP